METGAPVVPSTVLTDRLRMHRGTGSSPEEDRWAGYPAGIRRTLVFLQALSPEGRDAFLYACSAVFAGITAFAVGIPLYRQWGQLAVGPYVVATLIMVVVALRVRAGARSRAGRPDPGRTVPVDGTDPASPPATGDRRWRVVRVVAFLIVLFGATIVPLGLEVVWRSEGNAALHVQPEVIVVELVSPLAPTTSGTTSTDSPRLTAAPEPAVSPAADPAGRLAVAALGSAPRT